MNAMKPKWAIITLLLLGLFSCTSMLKLEVPNKKKVIKTCNRIIKKSKVNCILKVEEKRVTFLVRDNSLPYFDQFIEFNDKQKQTKTTLISPNDSLFSILLKDEIKTPVFRWTKLNDSTYLSSYDNRRILHIHEYNNSYEEVIFSFTRKEYKNLISKK